ncbi:MAG: DNA-directed RNA polymerase subunit omega [Epulopiscium sp.]|nr:DNA-directed RNA polymerase subunit omega [Candidatus Epulonipiscium sp.]HOQ15905.1 DNA-directed RNA polymerase subunit omega [Defluviitaleaceae bacterium]HPT75788.1 DNA-directed RNA polymerase subunit omega [Defluviitaleaceae bacterium]
MLKPSYSDLIEKLNEKSSDEEKPIITSRYSIVIATAKRAREIVDKGDPRVESKSNKPVSVAVEELYQGKTIIKYNESKTGHNVEEIEEVFEEDVKASDNEDN